MKSNIILITLFASALAQAEDIKDHPELSRILNKYGGITANKTCAKIVEEEFKAIASEELFESAVIFKNLKDDKCQMDFLAVGGKDYVTRDSDVYDKIMGDKRAVSAIDMHVHPLMNVDYFRIGKPYNGEIMFADAEMIRTAQLPGDILDSLNAAIKKGEIPGYSLSPPGMQDLQFAMVDTVIPVKNMVATSGGIWTYNTNGTKSKEDIRSRIEDFTIYGSMYEVAHSEDPNIKPEKKKNALRLFNLNMQDGDNKKIMLEWQACYFGLRKPYSMSAAKAYLAGDRSKIELEFREKTLLAKRWIDLMNELGFSLEFKPHTQN